MLKKFPLYHKNSGEELVKFMRKNHSLKLKVLHHINFLKVIAQAANIRRKKNLYQSLLNLLCFILAKVLSAFSKPMLFTLKQITNMILKTKGIVQLNKCLITAGIKNQKDLVLLASE